MSDTTTLVAEMRTSVGTSHSRRLRRDGKIPANLFGDGKDSVALTVASDAATPMVVGGANVIDLSIDGSTQKALIREVQWDTFLTHILHIDLQRLDASARVDVELAIEVVGVPNEGTLDQVMRSIELNCPATGVPGAFEIRVGALKIDDVVTVADLEIPEGCTTELPEDTVVLRVTQIEDVDVDDAVEEGALEPEVIGRSEEEDSSGAE